MKWTISPRSRSRSQSGSLREMVPGSMTVVLVHLDHGLSLCLLALPSLTVRCIPTRNRSFRTSVGTWTLAVPTSRYCSPSVGQYGAVPRQQDEPGKKLSSDGSRNRACYETRCWLPEANLGEFANRRPVRDQRDRASAGVGNHPGIVDSQEAVDGGQQIVGGQLTFPGSVEPPAAAESTTSSKKGTAPERGIGGVARRRGRGRGSRGRRLCRGCRGPGPGPVQSLRMRTPPRASFQRKRNENRSASFRINRSRIGREARLATVSVPFQATTRSISSPKTS